MKARRAKGDAMAVGAEGSYPSLSRGVVVVVLLFLAWIMSLFDRQVLSLLVEPIKADLRLSDFQFSLLQGLAFVVLHTTAGLFLGYLVDKVSRRNLIMVCLAFWSVATMACGLSRNFGQLFAARIAVGVGEAGLAPASISMLCDSFAPRHRGRAFGVIGVAGGLGVAVAMLVGGAIYRWLTENPAALGPLSAALRPWQLTFMVAGVPGLILTLAFLLVKEPARQDSVQGEADKASVAGFLRERMALMAALAVHLSLYRLIAAALLSWMTAHYMRRFGLSVFEAGATGGAIVVAGASGSLVAGFLGDRWVQRRDFGGRLRASVVSCALAAPGIPVWFLSPSLGWSIAGGALTWIGASITLTAAPIVVADVVPQQYRGRISSLYILVTSIFGFLMGPIAVAGLTDFVFRDEGKLHHAIVTATMTALALATLPPSWSWAAIHGSFMGPPPTDSRDMIA